MKVNIFSLALAFNAVASAIPTTQAAPGLAARDVAKGTIDCNYCIGMLNFCFENGHSTGQEGCKQTCREHVCHRTPECKQCHGEFSQCPDHSRFVH
ncbi:hypothetical protein SVAN01_06060 [Stagonosporopsis vannaccii]|nr:hypothetical protein SVAN01_06060 [Stagonosporopsis vannaccii]